MYTKPTVEPLYRVDPLHDTDATGTGTYPIVVAHIYPVVVVIVLPLPPEQPFEADVCQATA